MLQPSKHLNHSFYLHLQPSSMAEKKNKRIKSIRHRPITPRMEKEKETTKSGPSGRGKWIAHFPSPPTTPKETPWFFKE